MARTMSAQDVFLDGLRNAHAMEKQALSIMQPQLNRLEHYPEVSALLDKHIRETEGQIERLDEILAGMDASASGLKDAGLSLSGSMAAMSHTLAGDEILKNSFANFAFENFEAASYKSLLTIADVGGFGTATPLLTQSLNEELSMAAWVDENNATLTRRYLERRAAGETASH